MPRSNPVFGLVLDRFATLAMTAEGLPAMPRISLHRNAGEFDHLAPFLGLVRDQLAEFGRRHRPGDAACGGELLDDLRILQRLGDRLVEDLHDLRRRAPWRGDAVETDPL